MIHYEKVCRLCFRYSRFARFRRFLSRDRFVRSSLGFSYNYDYRFFCLPHPQSGQNVDARPNSCRLHSCRSENRLRFIFETDKGRVCFFMYRELVHCRGVVRRILAFMPSIQFARDAEYAGKTTYSEAFAF